MFGRSCEQVFWMRFRQFCRAIAECPEMSTQEWDRLARRPAWEVLVWPRLRRQAELFLQRQERLQRLGGVLVVGLLRVPPFWLGCFQRVGRGCGFGFDCECPDAEPQQGAVRPSCVWQGWRWW